MPVQNVSLEDAVASSFGSFQSGLWTNQLGQVVSFDARRQTANVQPLIQDRHIGEAGDVEVETQPVVPNVPVLFAGGGGFRTTYPVKAGDTGLLLHLSRSGVQWLINSGIVDPLDFNQHDHSDAVLIVGVRDYKHSLGSCPTDRMSIGSDSGATIEVRQDEIRIGSDAANQSVVVQSALDDFMSALGVAIAALTPGGVATAQALAAVNAINTALGALNGGLGWKAGTSKTKAE